MLKLYIYANVQMYWEVEQLTEEQLTCENSTLPCMTSQLKYTERHYFSKGHAYKFMWIPREVVSFESNLIS